MPMAAAPRDVEPQKSKPAKWGRSFSKAFKGEACVPHSTETFEILRQKRGLRARVVVANSVLHLAVEHWISPHSAPVRALGSWSQTRRLAPAVSHPRHRGHTTQHSTLMGSFDLASS